MKVQEKMRRDVITTSPNVGVTVARQLMWAAHVRQLPVVSQGRLVGLVFDRQLEGLSRGWVADVMSTGSLLLQVEPDFDLQEAAFLLWAYDVDGLPVTEDGELVGIITRTDVLHGFMSALGEPVFVLEDVHTGLYPVRRRA